MHAIDQKGLAASIALADVIAFLQNHPTEPIPMPKLRHAVEAQAEYCITLATNMLAHLGSQAIDKYVAEMNDQAQPGPDPDPH